MRHACPQCGKTHDVSDELLGKRMRCHQCGALDIVSMETVQAVEAPPEPTQVTETSILPLRGDSHPMTAEWYYLRNGEQGGPVTADELQQGAEKGQVQPTDMVWKVGLSAWVPASRVQGLFPTARPQAPTVPMLPTSPEIVGSTSHVGDPAVINSMIPATHRHLLISGEKAYHFEWIDVEGGCGTTHAAQNFILITDQRIMYESTVREGQGMNLKYSRTSGSIPLSKVSFVGTAGDKSGCLSHIQQGCNPVQAHLLKINSGGGTIEFPFFNEQKVKRVQRVIEELISK